MAFETPEIGHLVLDEYNHLGMVVEVEYLYDSNLYLVGLDWYIAGEVYRDHYRIGVVKNNDDIDFMRLSDYNLMRDEARKAGNK